MVQINFGRKEISCKIVYYGPGMSGKTTNLEMVHKKVPEQNRGDLTSISTDGDRTLYFDYMPLDLGSIAGMNTKFQLYTVPGQVYYNSTRKLVLQGVDGVVFVADSSPGKMKENLESLKNLEENLREYGKDLKVLPHVIQFNKRDLSDAMPFAEMEKQLNAHHAPVFEAVAATGQGVFPCLKALASLVLESVNKSGARAQAPAATPVAAAAPASASVGGNPPSAPTSSPFTRNVPPGQSNWQPSAQPPKPAEPPSNAPGKELHHLMADASKQDTNPVLPIAPPKNAPPSAAAASSLHSISPKAAAPAPKVKPAVSAASKIARAPIPAAAKSGQKPAAKPVAVANPNSKRNVIFAVVFGVLVLGAAGGIVMVLVF